MHRSTDRSTDMARPHAPPGWWWLPAVLVFCVPAQPARAQELPAWASEKLVLWVSAQAEASRRNVTSLPEDGLMLDTWRDRSLGQRHLVQPVAEKRPRLIRVASGDEGFWLVRFDGVDDHLRCERLGERLTQMSLFVVAAAHSNTGGFRGFFSANQNDQRDYQSGFTVDLGPAPSSDVQFINVEGRGFVGARNLLRHARPFSVPMIVEVHIDTEQKRARLVVDGIEQAERPVAGDSLIADQVTVGARFYENGPGPQRVQGLLHGDIAEILWFSERLNDEQRAEIYHYLETRYRPLRDALPLAVRQQAHREQRELLATVPNPPAVQMLVPGFVVRELPVRLTNINNIRYREDGKLYALAYSGDIWLLSDENGDGLEETARLFFENRGRLRGPIGMAILPPGHPIWEKPWARGNPNAHALLVASKGKVSVILDRDGDDVAEQEQVIASGWQEIPQNIDACGLAIDPAGGDIYFGLGTAAFNNPYLLDQQGRAGFDLQSVRGTIQRIAADLSGQQTVCTGVRFTIGMAFNEHGDLFVTDQEGATWLANGNPFDELLQIRPGRHYGFPPRHPRHLPRVFDEPSLYDYAPQHQSTCGLLFNLPLAAGGPIFGPDHWRADAIVAGESRGKLFRTRVVRERSGEYVAATQWLACLSMLTVDVCLAPDGDLVVACHSGPPDWGTGPQGEGRLFRISYRHRDLPQPVATWVPDRHTVCIGFDRPLEAGYLKDLLAGTTIRYGTAVGAGDRFESMRPPYAVVQLQLAAPRYLLPVYNAAVTADRRTLVLSTAAHQAACRHALRLPGLGREACPKEPGEIEQFPEIDLAYAPNGLLVTAVGSAAEPTTFWMPHPDREVAERLLAGYQPAGQWYAERAEAVGWKWETQLDVRGIFRPRLQPGSTLDYALEEDSWVAQRQILVQCDLPFQVNGQPANKIGELFTALMDVGQPAEFVPLEVQVASSRQVPSLGIYWKATMADGTMRQGPIGPERFWMPWVSAKSIDPPASVAEDRQQLAADGWGRGRRWFFSNEVGCGKCHRVGRDGSADLGPDLGNLQHRDVASVKRDIAQPGYAINPDYLSYLVELDDGRVLNGMVRNRGDLLEIADKEAMVVRVDRRHVNRMVPAATSIMPDGLAERLGEQGMRDLLSYLLLPPPQMPQVGSGPQPPPRDMAEVQAVLAGSQPLESVRPLHILLVAGAKDHGPGEHDYPAWLSTWKTLLEGAAAVEVDTAMEWPAPEQWARADTVVFYQRGQWSPVRAEAVDQHLARGKGLVYLHWAVEGGEHAAAFAQRIGLASQAGRLRFRHGPLLVRFSGDHPITRNFREVSFYDESYWQMQGDAERIRVLGTSDEEGEARPVFWTCERSGGRVFVSILGHYCWTFDDPLFRVLVLRGIAWSAGEPVDRFNELVVPGAAIKF
ncbi:MAG: hypothetical protein KatS3mg110_2649 [Pirellulaceae bacterium]|nr:MAG: hypothetical protein KatS3mg110_2649 [Pirellulaceae bacterium]